MADQLDILDLVMVDWATEQCHSDQLEYDLVSDQEQEPEQESVEQCQKKPIPKTTFKEPFVFLKQQDEFEEFIQQFLNFCFGFIDHVWTIGRNRYKKLKSVKEHSIIDFPHMYMDFYSFNFISIALVLLLVGGGWILFPLPHSLVPFSFSNTHTSSSTISTHLILYPQRTTVLRMPHKSQSTTKPIQNEKGEPTFKKAQPTDWMLDWSLLLASQISFALNLSPKHSILLQSHLQAIYDSVKEWIQSLLFHSRQLSRHLRPIVKKRVFKLRRRANTLLKQFFK